jgi:flagellar capping protein FliD
MDIQQTITNRIAELQTERDQFQREAEAKLTAYHAVIAELERMVHAMQAAAESAESAESAA